MCSVMRDSSKWAGLTVVNPLICCSPYSPSSSGIGGGLLLAQSASCAAQMSRQSMKSPPSPAAASAAISAGRPASTASFRVS